MSEQSKEEFQSLLKEVQMTKDVLVELQGFIRNEFVLFREQLYDHQKRIQDNEFDISEIKNKN